MLRNAHATTPSVLNLQVSLVLLQQMRGQLHSLLLGTEPAAAAHATYVLLSSIHVPDASCGWLLQRAQQVRMSKTSVHSLPTCLPTRSLSYSHHSGPAQ